MYCLEDIRKEFARLDAITGIDSSNVPITISYRSKVRRGCCVCEQKGVKVVKFSDFILNDPEEFFYDTVRHEYAHMLVKLRYPGERHGHDNVWKAACIEVGCKPNRLCTTTPEGRRAHEKANPYKYKLTCKACHTHWSYFRMTKCIRNVLNGKQTYICPVCGKKSFSVKQLR